MSDSKETPGRRFEAQMREDVLRGGGWHLPDYKAGQDDLWDQLGEDWRAVDGIAEGLRIYVRWDRPAGERARVSGLCVSGGPVTTETLRAIPISRLENLSATLDRVENRADQPEGLAPLVRRRGDDPEEFAERVAEYYRWFATFSNKPAKIIADHSGVPVGTVRGWIREARLRGKLSPGTQGRAG